jgi:CheY-like chemotaxis protein
MLQSDATVTLRNSHKWAPEAVLIFLTDVADEGIVEKCLQEGATDYLAEGGRLARAPESFKLAKS